MTARAPGPTGKEIERVGEILAQYGGSPARDALALFREGRAPWEGALRAVRTLIKEVFRQPRRGSKFPISARDALTEFAGKYGTETRSTAAEPLSVRKNLWLSVTDWYAIEKAAAAQGIKPTEFVRNAAVMAAREGQQ